MLQTLPTFPRHIKYERGILYIVIVVSDRHSIVYVNKTSYLSCTINFINAQHDEIYYYYILLHFIIIIIVIISSSIIILPSLFYYLCVALTGHSAELGSKHTDQL